MHQKKDTRINRINLLIGTFNAIQQNLDDKKIESIMQEPQLHKELAKLGIQENNQQAAKPNFMSCPQKVQYLINAATRKEIPLKAIEFNVEISNSVAEVQVSQVYENNSNQVIECDFVFAITARAAFHSLKVVFEDRIVIGVIKEKEQAKKEYQQGVQQGKTMVYSDVSKENPDLMKVKLGNLLPQQSLTILLSYVEELDVCINKFWRLSLVTTTTPRYTPSYQPVSQAEKSQTHQISQNNPQAYPLRVFIKIKSTSAINFLRSPTHQILQTKQEGQGLFHANVQLDESNQFYVPNKDFILLFANENINKPQVLLSKSSFKEPYCAQVTFVPEFNNLSVDDAYQAYLEENNLENDDFPLEKKYERGEYIFLIDRSGSMDGPRIVKAREALGLFIKSLPIDSYFNIYSFGSIYTKLFPRSFQYSKENIESSISLVRSFSADMGGTELYEAMIEIFTGSASEQISGYPKNIFILTDGAVSNSKEILGLIKLYTKPDCRVYTMGIGSGVSRFLVEMAAHAGGGMCEFVGDNEDLNSKVMTLLQDSITPYLSNVTTSLLPQDLGVQAIIPNPATFSGLRKNKPFTFYILFDKSLDALQGQFGEVSVQFSINDEKTFTNSLPLNRAHTLDTDVFHIIAAQRLIQSITDAAKYNSTSVAVLMKGPVSLDQASIVKTSIDYGVLSQYTSFICTVSDNADDIKRQQIANSDKVSIIVPTIESVDQSPYVAQPDHFSQAWANPPRVPQKQSYVGSLQQSCIPMSCAFSMPYPPQPPPPVCMSSMAPPPPPPCGGPPPPLAFMSGPPPPPGAAFMSRPSPPLPGAPAPQFSQAPVMDLFDDMHIEREEMNCLDDEEDADIERSLQVDQTRLHEVQEKCAEVQETMRANISQALQQNDSLDMLDMKAEQLSSQGQLFQKGAKKIAMEESKSSNQQAPVPLVNYMDVIMKQDFDGHFAYDASLLQRLGVSASDFHKLLVSLYQLNLYCRLPGDKIDIWFTLLILVWLEEKHKPSKQSWSLVHKKGVDYLKQQGVNIRDYKDVANKLLQ